MSQSIEALGLLQQEVMDEVWRMSQATVADVHDRLAQRRKIAYTTVLTTMRNLEKRGMLGHEQQGKVFLYRPTMPREQYAAGTVTNFVARVFGGKPEKLLCHLLGADEVSTEDVAKLKKLIEEHQQ
ncbi:MAG: BlaI/MecI/CopY family transcriptional regulator [Phycisphaerae bacterium]|nr:BlaI/MecI/CopY family transcriptional regulator [Phycisphaerae bacterium]